jgi:two-component system, OmpR family, catabolic regulation response regulator CreB
MNHNILVIEDESGIADTLVFSLATEGLNAVRASTGAEALSLISDKNTLYSLIILDIGLPDVSGFELIKKIRTMSEIPILCLTARAEEIDRILGLELGADDYVTKPFSPREVCARVKAILRRVNGSSGAKKISPFQIDMNKRVIYYFDEKLILSRYEYEILVLFINRPGWVFSREKIMDLVWLEPEESFDRTVDAHIKTIRAKLKSVKPEIDPIETHRGLGYALKEDL